MNEKLKSKKSFKEIYECKQVYKNKHDKNMITET